MESKEIVITNSTVSYGNLNLKGCGEEFFPKDIYGSPTKEKGLGNPVFIKVKGLSEKIKTDIPTDKSTNKPRWFFRERAWVKEFIKINNLTPGNILFIKRKGEREYEIGPHNGNNHKEKIYNTKNNKVERLPAQKKLLNINFTRTCECKENHLNCLTAKEWLKSQLGVWTFNYKKRDIRDKKIHPATFPISLATRVIELFTHKGELVLDPFAGSGTTLIAAQDTGRNSIGFDLKKEYVDLSKKRLEENTQLFSDSKQIAVCDDARKISEYLSEDSVKCIFTSPPYANLLNRKRKNKSRRNRDNGQLGKVEQYSQDPNDLGTMELAEYTKIMGDIFESLLKILKPKGHCVINVPDMWWENERISIHVSLIDELRKRGYEFRNIIIWDRTNLVNQIGIFGWPNNYITMGVTFEYLLDFWRPV
jgi:DNA modification methylase